MASKSFNVPQATLRRHFEMVPVSKILDTYLVVLLKEGLIKKQEESSKILLGNQSVQEGVGQCYRCQDFHHTQRNCHRQARCVIWSDHYLATECPRRGKLEILPAQTAYWSIRSATENVQTRFASHHNRSLPPPSNQQRRSHDQLPRDPDYHLSRGLDHPSSFWQESRLTRICREDCSPPSHKWLPFQKMQGIL